MFTIYELLLYWRSLGMTHDSSLILFISLLSLSSPDSALLERIHWRARRTVPVPRELSQVGERPVDPEV